MLVSGGQGIMRIEVTYGVFSNRTCCLFLLCEVLFVSSSNSLSCSAVFPLPVPPSLVDLVSIGLVSISTDLVSVTVPGGWWPLSELPWRPVCAANGLWLKACCSPRNRHPLWQAPSPSSSIGEEFKDVCQHKPHAKEPPPLATCQLLHAKLLMVAEPC